MYARPRQFEIHLLVFQDYDCADLADFAETILKGCDMNKEGKISKKVPLKYVVDEEVMHHFLGAYTDSDDSC